MTIHNWSDFWWNNITGANYVVSQVVQILLGNATAIVEVPADLPWRKEMRSAIETSFRSQSMANEMIVEVVDSSDEYSPGITVGKFLLDRYANSREVRNGYRERSGKSIQRYLIDNSVLKNRIMWIKGLSGLDANDWIKFCKEFDPGTSDKGLFVLEIHGSYPKIEQKNVHIVKLLDFVSNYDVQLLCSFILSNQANYSAAWKNYLSATVSSLCDTDAEIAEHILCSSDLKEKPFPIILSEIACQEDYWARGSDPSSKHILALVRKNNISEIEKRIWKAQVQALFPIIEFERMRIISVYRHELAAELNEYIVEQYKKRVTEPDDLELGTIHYMLASGLFTPHDKYVEDRIAFLHKCRNCLAHAYCCDTQQVKHLLDEEKCVQC